MLLQALQKLASCLTSCLTYLLHLVWRQRSPWQPALAALSGASALPNTADRSCWFTQRASSAPHDGILSASSASPSPPHLETGLYFYLKGKTEESEEMPATARQVWEKQAAHINLKLSQPGGGRGSPGGEPPSGGECSVGPRGRLGSISWTYLTWSPSKRCTVPQMCPWL